MSRVSLHSQRLIVALASAALALGCATTGTPGRSRTNAKRARSHYDIGTDHLQQRPDRARAARVPRRGHARPAQSRVPARRSASPTSRSSATSRPSSTCGSRSRSTPDFHDARLNLSALLLGSGRYEEARVEAQRLYDDPTFPGPWRALSNRGWAEYQLGRVDEARETLRARAEVSAPTTGRRCSTSASSNPSRAAARRRSSCFEAVISQRPAVRTPRPRPTFVWARSTSRSASGAAPWSI